MALWTQVLNSAEYWVMAAPLSAGAVHSMVIWPLPGVAVRSVGVSGAVAGGVSAARSVLVAAGSRDEVAADTAIESPAQAGQHGLVVGGFGHVHRLGPESVMRATVPRRFGLSSGQACGRARGAQDGHCVVIEDEVAADAVMPPPAHLG